jgi:predicted CoA-binding protein
MMENQSLINDFVNRRVWAVVGASGDRTKYGNRIFRSLQMAGYVVYPVNPKGGMLGSVEVYPTLADLPAKPDIVNVVVPPRVTEEIVREAHDLGLKRIWMQPGAESEEAVAFCREHGIEIVYHACAMVHRRRWDRS